MLVALKEKSLFYVILFIWWLTGTFAGPVVYAVIPLSLLFFWRSEMYEEMFIGFFFILILSDSLEFAKNVKDIYLVLLALFLLIGRTNLVLVNKLFIWFIPYFVVALICLFYSVSFFISFEKTISYLLLLIVVPNYIQNLYVEKGEVFFKNIVLFVLLFFLLGLLLRFIKPELVFYEGRYRGVFILNPNGLGVFSLLFFLFYSIINEYFPSLFSRRENIFIYSLCLFVVFLCSSRNAVISILIFLLFKYLYKISPFIGFLIFLLIIVTYEYIIANVGSIIMSLGLESFFRVETLETASGRYIAWKFAWDNIQQSTFFIGNGIGYTEALFKKHYVELSMLGHQGHAHNSYLTFWLDTGLIGLLLYLFGFIAVFVKGAKKTILSIPIMYAIFFSAFFESWLTASLNPFTIQVFAIVTIMTSDVFDNEFKSTNKTDVANEIS